MLRRHLDERNLVTVADQAYLTRVINDFESQRLLSPESQRELLPELVRFLPSHPLPGRDTFLILDIGSGPTTRLGTKVRNEVDAQVIPIDIAANGYAELMSDRGVAGPTLPVQMRAEDVKNHCPEGRVDLIFMRNVIHELDDPRQTIESLVPLLRPGCSLLVFNVTDERLSRYGRSPRWFVELEDDNIILSNDTQKVPLYENIVGATAKSYHQPQRSFAKLRVQRDGLNWRAIRAEWELGKRETMLFWSERAADPEAFPGFRKRFDPEAPLMDGIANHLPPGTAPVRILDVGSGPATNIGHKLPDRPVELTCIDVMAEPFNQLLADAGLRAPVPPVFGLAEEVGDQFGAGVFDVVFSRNALDHVAEPVKALQGMLTTTKPDGCVIVWGHVNEGENERYRGYHQWNFCWADDDFLIWRPGYRQAVSEIFGEPVSLTNEGSDDLYRIVIRRMPIT
jgi:SAM-dependent methyltransferase